MAIDKRAAKAAYRDRKSAAGIYAVRCAAAGLIWVGHTLTLDTIQNRLWFMLRQKGHPDAVLQRVWNEQGGAGFTFDALERVKDEDLSAAGDGELKKRAARWRTELGALDLI
ncbi:MAG TPA: GIY-YIG nuclease family protein [Stellaceae bacterium]|nr:GIY-YIG nuclease family protein [Stellaceae bacterium]